MAAIDVHIHVFLRRGFQPMVEVTQKCGGARRGRRRRPAIVGGRVNAEGVKQQKLPQRSIRRAVLVEIACTGYPEINVRIMRLVVSEIGREDG
jgi:hypothetical protein